MEDYYNIKRSEIDDLIGKVDYIKLSEFAILCVIKLKDTDYIIKGFSSTIDKNKYNYAIGCEIAYNNAIDKLYEYESYFRVRNKIAK